MPNRLSDLARKLFARPRRQTTPPTRTRLTLTPLEDRVVPTAVVTIAAIANGTEGGGDVTFRLTRTDTTGNLTVNLSVDTAAPIDGAAVATAGTDYTAPTSAMFPNGQATVDMTITPTNDSTSEPTEAITLVVGSGLGYSVGSPASATAVILDNDVQVVSVANGADAREGGADGTFVLTRIGDLSGSLTVNYTVGGTATSGTDFTSIGTSVAFAAGSATATVTVTAADDTGTYDPDETVTLTVGTGTGYSVGSPSSATVTIEDNAAGTFTLSGASGQIWYEIPWGDVDFDDSAQSVPLSNFTLVFNGQTFTEANATFSIDPTAEFDDGELTNIKFKVEFASPVAGYQSVALDNGQITGVNASTQEPENTTLQNTEPPEMVIEFSPMAFPSSGPDVTWTIKAQTKNGTTITDLGADGGTQINIPVNGTPAAVRTAMKTSLKGLGLSVETDGDTRLVVRGPVGSNLWSVTIQAHVTTLPTGPSAIKAKNGGQAAPTYTFEKAP